MNPAVLHREKQTPQVSRHLFFVAKATVSLGLSRNPRFRRDDLSHSSSLPSDWQRAASTAKASWHLEVQFFRRFTYLSFS
jgi:hypothetical protein